MWYLPPRLPSNFNLLFMSKLLVAMHQICWHHVIIGAVCIVGVKLSRMLSRSMALWSLRAMMTSSNGTISTLLTICAGNSQVTGELPAQRPVTRSFDVFFDLCLNKRWSKQWLSWWFETPSRPLWRHRNGTAKQHPHNHDWPLKPRWGDFHTIPSYWRIMVAGIRWPPGDHYSSCYSNITNG